jgi:hypothetical protein
MDIFLHISPGLVLISARKSKTLLIASLNKIMFVALVIPLYIVRCQWSEDFWLPGTGDFNVFSKITFISFQHLLSHCI